jgi:acetylglutamate kinase
MNPEVIGALRYVAQFAGTRIVVKIGGSVLDDEETLQNLCDDLFAIRKVGVELILVHGGRQAINDELTRRGIEWRFEDGIRVTTPQMMDVVEMVLCGQVNRRLVRALQASGLKAVGLSGADAGTLICKRGDERWGQVGTVERVGTQLLKQILEIEDELGKRAIPVVAPVGLGRDGTAYNVNAEWAASRIASEMGVTKMIFMADQDGIVDAKGKLIPELDAGELEQLIEDGVLKDGQLARARTILQALQNKVPNVHILNARKPHALIEELFTDHGSGTVCRLRSRGGS